MKPKINSFIAGFASATLLYGVLFVITASRRSHHAADEMIAALEDPDLKERYQRTMSDMQKDSLAVTLQALAARAVFSMNLIALRLDHDAALKYQVSAISEFLDSESAWSENPVTFRMIDPVLTPTKKRLNAFLSENPDIEKMVDTHRKQKAE